MDCSSAGRAVDSQGWLTRTGKALGVADPLFLLPLPFLVGCYTCVCTRDPAFNTYWTLPVALRLDL